MAKYAPVPEKRCTWCGDVKPAADFYLRPSNRSGLTSHCCACQKASARRAELKNPQRARAKKRGWKKRNPDKVMARSKIDNRRAYQRHAGKIKARVRSYAEANRDKIAARMSSPAGRLKRRMNEGRRRAKMQGRITPEQWTAALAAWGDRCAYCGAGGPLQLDHFVPIARGGVHEIHNAVPACERCNKSKCARDPWEFLSETRAPPMMVEERRAVTPTGPQIPGAAAASW